MIYIGIDNGLTGGIAILEEGKLSLHVMPVFSDGKKKRVDVDAFDEILNNYIDAEIECKIHYPHFIAYERPGGSKSVKAAVSMADSFARMDAVMIIRTYRRDPITPQKWQKMFWTKPKMPKGVKFDTKAAALKVARQLWPEQNWLASSRCRVPHDGLVDAALIAEYCRRTYT